MWGTRVMTGARDLRKAIRTFNKHTETLSSKPTLFLACLNITNFHFVQLRRHQPPPSRSFVTGERSSAPPRKRGASRSRGPRHGSGKRPGTSAGLFRDYSPGSHRTKPLTSRGHVPGQRAGALRRVAKARGRDAGSSAAPLGVAARQAAKRVSPEGLRGLPGVPFRAEVPGISKDPNRPGP